MDKSRIGQGVDPGQPPSKCTSGGRIELEEVCPRCSEGVIRPCRSAGCSGNQVWESNHKTKSSAETGFQFSRNLCSCSAPRLVHFRTMKAKRRIKRLLVPKARFALSADQRLEAHQCENFWIFPFGLQSPMLGEVEL